MNSFRQHVPNCIDMDQPPDVKFGTVEQLLEIDVIKRFSQIEGHDHFALKHHTLMQVSDDGFHWWVMGYIKCPEDIDPTTIPEWEGPKYQAELEDGTQTVLSGKEVSYSRGDMLSLTNGQTARWVRNGV